MQNLGAGRAPLLESTWARLGVVLGISAYALGIGGHQGHGEGRRVPGNVTWPARRGNLLGTLLLLACKKD